jgi:hypothetical protein
MSLCIKVCRKLFDRQAQDPSDVTVTSSQAPMIHAQEGDKDSSKEEDIEEEHDMDVDSTATKKSGSQATFMSLGMGKQLSVGSTDAEAAMGQMTLDNVPTEIQHGQQQNGDDKTYGGGNIKGINMPMHGIGQGNGMGPAIWAVISCLILEIMHKQGYVATFVSAISWMSIALCGFLFVDDADLLFTAPTTHQWGEEIAESAQRHLDEWEGLIHATGGALVPSKSFWYLVDFQWDGTDWIYRDTADMPASILV